MITLNISLETYSLISSLVSSFLESQMFHGVISNWDDENCKALVALVELTKPFV